MLEADRRKKRVLVIDDEPQVCEIVRVILSDEGFEVDCADRGPLGVTRFYEAQEAKRPYDVVISDLSLEGLDGYDIYMALSHHHRGTFIVITGGPRGKKAAAALEALLRHGVVVLQKPFDRDQLLSVVGPSS
ncbi:response regulator [Candidatus Uhrbacteria bacterium]|nr:response regulator [Candidatus Uhrbacteria bacterium]